MLKKLENRQWDKVRAGFLEMHPSEAADTIEELPGNERAAAFRLSPEPIAADIFEYLDLKTQQGIINNPGKRQRCL